jgi:isoamylase
MPDGVNFSLFSDHATGVKLLLFETHDAPQPFQEIPLDPLVNKTGHFWHVFVAGLRPGAHYAYRVKGPGKRSPAYRFRKKKVLIDPYARANSKTLWNRADACGPDDNVETSMRSAVVDTSRYDWEGDQPHGRDMEDTIIYEMHVRGFTRSPSSGVKDPGTFDGIVEKIPYLKDLGITAIELLPVFDFDETEVLRVVRGQPLVNYWGYSTIGFFALQSAYCVRDESRCHLDQFRNMVKALHKDGIEVILDVVFNHTDEGDDRGPVFSFKGIDNRTYYLLVPWNLQYYLNFARCGNTFNCSHPIVQKLIVDCLRYWVREMHVDGFRFDAGSILARDQDGRLNPQSALVWQIDLDDELAHTKVIVEPWDAEGPCQLGRFPGERWAEWNACYRDDVRRFVRGEPGRVGAVATRLAGSSDLYERRGQLPVNSVNFVTCHDGFTLNDLVSYAQKDNEPNGDGNGDGTDDNLSWNCGVEGETDDPGIEALRERQVRNFAAILLLSRGVPMILAGDEVRRTQRGNNNAYCQDNPTNWFDWSLVEKNRELLRFWRRMIAFRKTHAALRQGRFFKGAWNARGLSDVTWHGTTLREPGFRDRDARALGMTLAGFGDDPDIHVMMNMHWEPLDFKLPEVPDRSWFKAVDTFQAKPDDIPDPGKEPPVVGDTCTVQARSVVVLVNREQTMGTT